MFVCSDGDMMETATRTHAPGEDLRLSGTYNRLQYAIIIKSVIQCKGDKYRTEPKKKNI